MHVMLDLETLGTRPNSVIASIGATYFNPSGNEVHAEDGFYVRIDIESCVEAGLVIDPATILWWLQQSEQARKSTFEGPKFTLEQALGQFSDFLRKSKDLKNVRVWGNGSDFDNVILGNAYKALGYRPPWSYGKNRCFRTVNSMLHPKGIIMPTREGTHHNALDDAVYQAKVLQAIVSAHQLIVG